jgi:hypothetical protein
MEEKESKIDKILKDITEETSMRIRNALELFLDHKEGLELFEQELNHILDLYHKDLKEKALPNVPEDQRSCFENGVLNLTSNKKLIFSICYKFLSDFEKENVQNKFIRELFYCTCGVISNCFRSFEIEETDEIKKIVEKELKKLFNGVIKNAENVIEKLGTDDYRKYVYVISDFATNEIKQKINKINNKEEPQEQTFLTLHAQNERLTEMAEQIYNTTHLFLEHKQEYELFERELTHLCDVFDKTNPCEIKYIKDAMLTIFQNKVCLFKMCYKLLHKFEKEEVKNKYKEDVRKYFINGVTILSLDLPFAHPEFQFSNDEPKKQIVETELKKLLEEIINNIESFNLNPNTLIDTCKKIEKTLT